MKSKIKIIEECATQFDIVIPKETIDKAFEEVYSEIAKAANISGFRPGKAPIDLVRKQYAKDAESEVLKRVIPDSYRTVLDEHKVSPVGMPEITDVKFGEDRILSFKAKVETRPKFKLKDYLGIRIQKKASDIKDEDVAKALENLREMSAKYIAVEGRPAQMGDYIVSDLECSVEGKPVHKKRENLWLFLEKESLVPGLSEKIVGIKPGEEREIEAAFPDKYPDKNIAGKPALYKVKAKEIKERRLPVLDDEFAKDLKRDNLEDLKVVVREELEKKAKINAEVDAENKLLDALADDNVFAVPRSFVKTQMGHMVEDAKANLAGKGFSREELDKKDKDFADKFKNDAERRVRILFILDEIAHAQGIDVSEKEMDEAYKSISAQTGKSEEEVKAYYRKEDLDGSLEEKIRETKTIEFLLKNAEVIEKG